MLRLKNIKKDYNVADYKVHALKGVSISFRQNEFVSILGPSGCGKTTLLNIIGGLDHYTSGELYIDGVSTKNYGDRDWDTYRNHRIGFVFQSYNLIPHQTVLENVELSLTISGMDKKERVKKAKEALDKVGLKGEYNKKPNQLSGGQCQRVAIARALVNEPEILLADEPTGALDTVTSTQIMDLIQEIAKECLVIMVTHNPEIAEKYSSRIIKLLDGEVVSDSNPFDEKDEHPKKKKEISRKSKLSWWTAFKLSAKNLWSKAKRTVAVCIAGSIGIIGIACVLAVSTGVQNYINSMQNDMLSGNPIMIEEETYNINALMESSDQAMKTQALKKSVEDGYVNVDSLIEFLLELSGNMSSFSTVNDINETYLKYLSEMPEEYYAAIAQYYGISVGNNIYTEYNFNGHEGERLSIAVAKNIYTAMLNVSEYKEFSTYTTSLSDTFMQAPSNEEFILSQYDILSDKDTSKIATEANEIMIVVSDETELTDLLLAQLGYYSQDEFFNMVYKAAGSERYDESIEKSKFSYDELLGKKFTWYPNDTVYSKTDASSPMAMTNPFTYDAYASDSWTGGLELEITAILRPKASISYGCLSAGFYYTEELTKHIIQNSITSEIVNYLNTTSQSGFNSSSYNGANIGITYTYDFTFEGNEYLNNTGFVGSISSMSLIGGMMGAGEIPAIYTLTLRELGGCVLPNSIAIYPTDFNYKDSVTSYLDAWNGDGDIVVDGKTITSENRSDVIYSDMIALIIGIINTFIEIVTIALVAFTALSLVVSTVMIAIITYVSVIERVKEIGVIRSLGGRKKDVAALFNAETFIIGTVSGLIGIGVTGLISAILNLIMKTAFGIPQIATLTLGTAVAMMVISIVLTSISGLIPASLAAKKDPVVALRSE